MALGRARGALSAPRQRALSRLLRRILIGRPASDVVSASLGTIDDELLPVFEHCFTASRAMLFDYVDWHATPSVRRAECVALMPHTPAWYVVAWDLEKDAPRVFRMDRIRNATPGALLTGGPPPAQRGHRPGVPGRRGRLRQLAG